MIMGRIVFLVLLLHFVFNAVCTQEKEVDGNTPVARIGNEVITAEEFRRRFEMTVWPGKHQRGYLNTVKQRFLYGMIAEKLLAMEARETGFEIHPEIQRQIDRLERMLIRDRLYRDMVQRKVHEAEPEFRQVVERAYTDLRISFLYSDSPEDIYTAWKKTQEGNSLEELESPDALTYVRDYHVRWDQTYPALIETLDTLDVNEISEPVETSVGWYIVQIDEKQRNDGKIKNDLLERLKTYEEYLMRHSYEIRDAEFIESLIAEYGLQVDAMLFDTLSAAIENMLINQYGDELYGYAEIMFVRDEIDELKRLTHEYLDAEFIHTDNQRWTLDAFVNDMYSRKIEFTGDPDMTLNRRVRNTVNDQILDYLITKKAYDLDLHEHPDVRAELDRWERHYIAESYKQHLTTDVRVDELEVFNYYEDHRDEFDNPVEVNIREILVRTRPEAMEMIRMLEEGKDFGELARRYSIRNWSARQDGEFGYFPSTSYGEIGRIAAMLEPGQRFGPILIDEGYTIFELIDKRPSEHPGAQELEEVEESIEERLLGRKRREVINVKVKMLADKHIVDIDYETLHAFEVSPLQVLVIRHFGFGGVFPAVPFLDQILQWSEEWLIDHNLAL